MGIENLISDHSLSAGFADLVAKAGATFVDIKIAGRYVKVERTERGAITRFKDGKG